MGRTLGACMTLTATYYLSYPGSPRNVSIDLNVEITVPVPTRTVKHEYTDVIELDDLSQLPPGYSRRDTEALAEIIVRPDGSHPGRSTIYDWQRQGRIPAGYRIEVDISYDLVEDDIDQAVLDADDLLADAPGRDEVTLDGWGDAVPWADIDDAIAARGGVNKGYEIDTTRTVSEPQYSGGIERGDKPDANGDMDDDQDTL